MFESHKDDINLLLLTPLFVGSFNLWWKFDSTKTLSLGCPVNNHLVRFDISLLVCAQFCHSTS